MRRAAVARKPAVTATTNAGPAIASPIAANAGPTSTPAPSTVLDAALAAVSSSGVSARCGRIALWTGRVSVIAQLARTAAA